MKIKTRYIRYTRIAKHFIQYCLSNEIKYWYEIEHYYYMKSFTDIK